MTHDPGLLDVLRFYYHAPASAWRFLTADRTAFVILAVVAIGALIWMAGAADRRREATIILAMSLGVLSPNEARKMLRRKDRSAT